MLPDRPPLPGIAHLLRAVTRGLVEELAADSAWAELPIALIDVETTGMDASVDRVVEIGVVDRPRRGRWSSAATGS